MEIKEIKDKQHPYPSIEELRRLQKAGSEGRGLPENSTDALGEAEGHNPKIEEDE